MPANRGLMRGVKLFAIGGTLVAGLFVASAVSHAEAPDGLIYDAMAAPATISYTGIVESVRIGNQGSVAYVYRIEHRAPNLTLRQYTSPSNLAGDSLVSRGDESFNIDPKRRRVTETRNDAINDQIAIDNNYLLLRQNYRAITRGDEIIAGRHAIDVALVNNYTHHTGMLVRLDEPSKLVLDKQQYAGDGSLVAETRFEEISFSTNVPSSDFDVPQDYAVEHGPSFGPPSDDPHGIVGRAGFNAREPKFLPDGFSPVEATLVSLDGVQTLHLLYSDGLRTVSLFQSQGAAAPDMAGLHGEVTTISGQDAQYAEEGPTKLLSWRDSGLYYTLVGELQLDELKRIASSIAP
jgi:negative regulator of sigma E activity